MRTLVSSRTEAFETLAFLRHIALLTVLLVPLSFLQAQTTGTLLGTVADQSAAVVPQAEVTLQNETSGDIRTTKTNEVGRFTFAGVRPGTYTIKITSENFKTWQRTGFVMNGSDTRDLSDIHLEIGSSAQTVSVESTALQVDLLKSGERSAVLSTKDLNNLALVSRNVSELLKVLPIRAPQPAVIQDHWGGSFQITEKSRLYQGLEAVKSNQFV